MRLKQKAFKEMKWWKGNGIKVNRFDVPLVVVTWDAAEDEIMHS